MRLAIGSQTEMADFTNDRGAKNLMRVSPLGFGRRFHYRVKDVYASNPVARRVALMSEAEKVNASVSGRRHLSQDTQPERR
jgi:hypothetical protein